MYQDILLSQWENLISDFFAEIKGDRLSYHTPVSLNEWYSARSFRFSSSSDVESLLLNQCDNPDFAATLRGAIQRFSFQPVALPSKPSVWPRLLAGTAAAVFIGLFLRFLFHFAWWTILLDFVLILGVVLIEYFPKKRLKQEQAMDAVRSEYCGQLKAYQEKLIEICNLYQVD